MNTESVKGAATERGRLGSRFGFLMLAAGSAVGLGNVWRFPYLAGKNGGAVFVLVYLFFLAVLGIPLLVAEFAVGRAAKASLPEAMRRLAPARYSRIWGGIGALSASGCLVMLFYYTDITGWLLKYACDYLRGLSPDPASSFDALMKSGATRTVFMAAVVGGSACACFAGVAKGVERVTKSMMACLFALIALLAVKSLFLPGAMDGVSFYLKPDWSRFMQNPSGVAFDAMGQAFFTLSVGIGTMAVCGSYTDRGHSLVKEASIITAIDTAIALLAGVAIFPACASFGIEYASGPGLVFHTLPQVFAKMPCGAFWGGMFFLFFSFAALTSVIAVLECIVAALSDCAGLKRRTATAVSAAVVFAGALACICVDGLTDKADFAVSQLWLPLGALSLAVFVSSGRFGWGWRKFRAEAGSGRGWRLPDAMRPLYAFVMPLLILCILAAGL